MSVEYILTDATCSESCWHAKEAVCRCSCGGKNHGCLVNSNGDGLQPVRSCKIDGFRYELKAVGTNWDVSKQSSQLCREAGPRVVTYPSGRSFTTRWRDNDKGAPARVKLASREQVARWPELSTYVGSSRRPYLLWVKVDAPLPSSRPIQTELPLAV
jgi:hypothetical protein